MLLGVEVLHDGRHRLDVRDASRTQILDDGLALRNVPFKHIRRDACGVANGFPEFGWNPRFFDLVGRCVVLPNGVEARLVAFHAGDFRNFRDFTGRSAVDVKTSLNDDQIESAQHDGRDVHGWVDHSRDGLLGGVGVE